MHEAKTKTWKEISPHQFEWWAVDMVNARPAKDHKKGADTVIDGVIIGPSDLTADLGCAGDFSQAAYARTVAHIEQAAAAMTSSSVSVISNVFRLWKVAL